MKTQWSFFTGVYLLAAALTAQTGAPPKAGETAVQAPLEGLSRSY